MNLSAFIEVVAYLSCDFSIIARCSVLLIFLANLLFNWSAESDPELTTLCKLIDLDDVLFWILVLDHEPWPTERTVLLFSPSWKLVRENV